MPLSAARFQESPILYHAIRHEVLVLKGRCNACPVFQTRSIILGADLSNKWLSKDKNI
jgi:hypothetical protein